MLSKNANRASMPEFKRNFVTENIRKSAVILKKETMKSPKRSPGRSASGSPDNRNERVAAQAKPC